MPLFWAVIFGALLRLLFLDKLPVSPNWDEVSHGINAYSILMTGKDEWGKSFPLIFRAFGDYKLPAYIYLSIVPVWLFGLNVFAVRLVSALAGVLAIPGIYLLVRQLFPEKTINLGKFSIRMEILAAFILAILPWHIFISRPALEANLALTFIIFGFYYLLRFFEDKASLLPAVIFLGLSLHTYNTARVFVPLLIIASIIIYRPKIKLNLKTTLAVLLTIIFSGLVIFQVYMGEGTARYEKLKILSPETVFQIGERRSKSDLPPTLSRLVYNRPVYFISTVVKNYLSYLSPNFFYQKWGAQYQFAIPKQNLLTLPVFLLAFFGFFTYLRWSKSSPGLQFLYSWLLLSPLAASLTIDPPQALRPNPMIPALVIFAILGLIKLLEFIPGNKKNIVIGGVGLWIIYTFATYVISYTTDYAKQYSSSWQYGYSQVMAYVNDHHKEYDRVFITKRYGEPHIFYAFFTKLSPKILQPNSDNIRFEKSDWFWTDKIGNVYFINDWQIPTIGINTLRLESGGEISTRKSLLITSPDHVPVNAQVIETINLLDGSPVFIITSVP